ncbi:MAG TPA: PQQ-dependent sugar dehydrogenase [Usitatibacter sp.]|nr:PQQ-dependent sugar dehydrogenase [Usitatibacter sp.]
MTRNALLLALCLAAVGCAQTPDQPAKVEVSAAANPTLPPNVPAWKQGMPDITAASPLAPHAGKMTVTAPADIPVDKIKAPPGFHVELWASGMPGARMMTRGEQGRIYVGTRAIGRVYEITDKGSTRESRIVVDKLTQPNGLAFNKGSLYVMAIDKVLRYDGIEGNPGVQAVDMTAAFKLPPKQHHNWKFLNVGPDGKLYVPFGAPCNICDVEPEYAQIRRYNWDGSGMEVVARGVRNTVGFDWHPKTKELWFTDNGRDWMGDDGPDDELNRVTRVGEFFGFPYCHANGIPDRDVKKPDPCKGVTMPAALLGPHVAALGMRFYTGSMFPAEYRDTAFIARHGAWNRSKLTGFDVVRAITSADGKARIEPFLTGFMDPATNKFWGRPADVLVMPDGALLVSDDQNGAIYRVSYRR